MEGLEDRRTASGAGRDDSPGAWRPAAAPEEVAFLASRALGEGADVDDPAFPRARENFELLAGLAAEARRAGTPFEAVWSLVAEVKRLDELTDPVARGLWGRIRRAMKELASPDWTHRRRGEDDLGRRGD